MIRMVDIQVEGDLLLVLDYEASSLHSTFIIRDHIVFKLVNLSLFEQGIVLLSCDILSS